MTTAELKKRIDELERQVKELLEWKRKKEQQQISYPLDQASKTIITNI